MKDIRYSRLKRFLSWLVATVALGFFVHRMFANAAHMPHIAWNAMTYVVAVASMLLALLAIVLAGAIWLVLLREQAILVPWQRVQSLYLVAQFGKYLPGNVGQYVGRIMLGKDMGIPVPVTLATMVTEVLWGVGTALGLAALSLYLFVGPRLAALSPWMDAAGLALCFVGLLVSPWLGMTIAKSLFPNAVTKVFGSHGITSPGWRAALKVSVLYVACSLCMGLILQWQSRYVFGTGPAPLLQLSGFFALAWLAGYVLPGAPAGIGVRESMMVLLFTPTLGEGTALALGVTLRFATTLADILAFAIGWAWRYAQLRNEHHRQGIRGNG